jgi:hypothetical protein
MDCYCFYILIALYSGRYLGMPFYIPSELRPAATGDSVEAIREICLSAGTGVGRKSLCCVPHARYSTLLNGACVRNVR